MVSGRRAGARRAWLALGAIVAAVGAGTGLGAAIWAGSGTPAGTRAGVLYVVEGTGGIAERGGDGRWLLRVRGASVLWFTDRPERRSGSRSIASLVSGWAGAFAGSAPNAAIALRSNGPGDRHPVAMKVSRVSFDAADDLATFTLAADATEDAQDAAWLAQLDAGAERRNGPVVLFIDDAQVQPPPPQPSPAAVIAAASAEGETSISVLSTQVAAGGALGAIAQSELEKLAQQASAAARQAAR